MLKESPDGRGAQETSVITFTPCFHVSCPVLSPLYELAPSFYMESPEDSLITPISQMRTLRHRGRHSRCCSLQVAALGLEAQQTASETQHFPRTVAVPGGGGRWVFLPRRTPGNICRHFQLSRRGVLQDSRRRTPSMLLTSHQAPGSFLP